MTKGREGMEEESRMRRKEGEVKEGRERGKGKGARKGKKGRKDGKSGQGKNMKYVCMYVYVCVHVDR